MPTLSTSLIRCTNAYDINLFLCIHSCRYILDIGLNAFLLNIGRSCKYFREIETKRFVSPPPIPTSTHNHVTMAMSHLFLRVSLGVYSIRKNTIFMLCGQCVSQRVERRYRAECWCGPGRRRGKCCGQVEMSCSRHRSVVWGPVTPGLGSLSRHL